MPCREPTFVLIECWVFGLAVLFFLCGLLVSGVVKRGGRLVALTALAILLVLALWPVLSGIILFVHGQYLLGVVAILYALPYCVGFVIGIRPLIKLWKLVQLDGAEVAKSRMMSWSEKVRREAPTDDQYSDSQGFVWRMVSKVLIQLSAIFILPTLFLKVALGTWLGSRVAWWPDFDPASFVLFGFLSYIIASAHHPAIALTISVYLFVLKLFDVVTRFETHHGVLKMLSYKKHQVGLSSIVFAALIMAASCGCIHYCISLLNPSAYFKPLTAIDGLYFSVTTFAMVGYGDIYPRTDLAKLACVGEIVSGCLVLVFGVNLAMTIWVQKFAVAKADSAEPSVAAELTPKESVSSSESAHV